MSGSAVTRMKDEQLSTAYTEDDMWTVLKTQGGGDHSWIILLFVARQNVYLEYCKSKYYYDFYYYCS